MKFTADNHPAYVTQSGKLMSHGTQLATVTRDEEAGLFRAVCVQRNADGTPLFDVTADTLQGVTDAAMNQWMEHRFLRGRRY